jgi:hypothetical protein
MSGSGDAVDSVVKKEESSAPIMQKNRNFSSMQQL